MTLITLIISSGLLLVAVLSSQPKPEQPSPATSPNRTLRQATELIEKGDLDTAENLLAKVLSADPRNSEALLYRGHVARERGDVESAFTYWKQIPDSQKQFAAPARYIEGVTYLEQNKASAAEALFKRATELNPAYLPPRQRLLSLYVAQLRSEDIRRELTSLSKLRPLTLEELTLELSSNDPVLDSEQGIETTRAFFEADQDDVHSLIALARYLADEHRDEAISLLESQPDHRERTRTLLANLYLDSGNIHAADRLLTEQTVSDRSTPFEFFVLGRLREAQENWPEAAAAYAESIRRDATNGRVRYQFGRLLGRLGRHEEATAQLKQAKLLDDLKAELYRVSRGNKNRPDLLSPVLTNVADRLKELGRTQDAANWYLLAIEADPSNQRARQHYVLLQQRDESSQPNVTLPDPRSFAGISTPPPPTNQMQTQRPQQSSSIQLIDEHSSAGIAFSYFNGETGKKYLVESVGGGVAVLDYDGDDWPDLYFCQGSDLPHDPENTTHTDRLYRNRRDGTFEDVTEHAGIAEYGYSLGCTAADIDNDGDPDLYVTNHGRDTLYINNGDGTFTDATLAAGLLAEAMSASAGFADFDTDGDLDLYVATYVDSLLVCRDDQGRFSTCDPHNHVGASDLFYRNNGDGTFDEISIESGIASAPDGKGLGLVITDLDGDNRPDVYVSNDTTANFLFLNRSEPNGPIRFEEYGLSSGTALNGNGEAEAGMGIACADFNGDSLPDLHVTNFYRESNTLYQNLGNGLFEDVTRLANLAGPTLPWLGFGTQAADFDLNGTPDLFVANGHIDNFEARGEPWKMPPQLFRNLGNAKFEEVSETSGAFFSQRALGRAVARTDWNRDGRPDLVVVHQDRPAALLTNITSDAGNYLRIRLHGTTSNRDAIGAQVQVTAGGFMQTIPLCGGDGIMSTNERTLTIGIGEATRVDQLRVTWPSGEQTSAADLPSNSTVLAIEKRSIKPLLLNPVPQI